LLEAIAAGSDLGTSWLIAKDWYIESRFDPRPFPPRRARDMLHTVDTMGPLKWLLIPSTVDIDRSARTPSWSA
jgi:hypothetical protein